MAFKNPTIEKTCAICKTVFFVYPYRKDIAQFCSHKCYAKTVHLQTKTENWYKAMQNHTVWNKGLSWSKKMKQKLSKSQKKRFESQSVWNKGLKGFRAGEKSHLWKGGITPENRQERMKFRLTMQKLVFERDNYTCVLCGSQKDLQVDHIQPWAEYVDQRFNINNCQTLCAKCHYEITFGKPMPENVKAWGHNLGKVVFQNS